MNCSVVKGSLFDIILNRFTCWSVTFVRTLVYLRSLFHIHLLLYLTHSTACFDFWALYHALFACFQISFSSDWFIFRRHHFNCTTKTPASRSHGTYIIKECISHTQSNYLISLMTIQTFKVNVLMCVHFANDLKGERGVSGINPSLMQAL